MLLTFEILIIIFSIFILFYSFKASKNIHTIVPIIIVFDLVMVFPLILEIIFGIPKAYYRYYKLALADEQTLHIYLSFIALAQFSFFYELFRIKKNSIVEKKVENFNVLSFFQNINHKTLIKFCCLLLFFISIIAIFCSPDPFYYFRINSVYSTHSIDTLQYKNNIMNNLCSLLFLSVILLKLIDNKDKIFDSFLRTLFIILIAFINQKRTLLLIIVGVFLIIDFLKSKKKSRFFFKYSIVLGIMIFYFYYYTIITGKISYNSDWYYLINEYIFRSMHMRFAIYAYLHSNTIHILDYPGQSFLFSLFYFIPRSIWPTKPFPYIDYYMRGLLNYSSLSLVTYHMPASYYPEFVSNFGMSGIILSIVFTIWYARFFDKQNGISKFIGIALIALLQIYYYDDMLKILSFALLLVVIGNKFKVKKM